jgi:hypothetical protein
MTLAAATAARRVPTGLLTALWLRGAWYFVFQMD